MSILRIKSEESSVLLLARKRAFKKLQKEAGIEKSKVTVAICIPSKKNLRKLNLNLKNSKGSEVGKRRALSTITRDELEALAGKHTTSEISVILGFGETYIRSVLVKHGIEFRPVPRVGRPPLPDGQRSPRSRRRVKKPFVGQQVTWKPVYESSVDRAKRLGYID